MGIEHDSWVVFWQRVAEFQGRQLIKYVLTLNF